MASSGKYQQAIERGSITTYSLRPSPRGTVQVPGGDELTPLFPPTIGEKGIDEDGEPFDNRGGDNVWIVKLGGVDRWLVGGVLIRDLTRDFYGHLRRDDG